MTCIPFPGFQHLHELTDPLSNRPLRGNFETDADANAITRGEILPSRPISVSWAMGGGAPSDFVWSTLVHPMVVHRRVIDLLQERGITGWQRYGVRLSDKRGQLHVDYDGLAITGRCGPVDFEKSIVVLSKYPTGRTDFLGLFFNESSWDGSDLFMETADSRGGTTGRVFVTEHVRSAFRKGKVRNVRLERLTDVRTSTLIYTIGRTYKLPVDFDRRVTAAYARSGVKPPNRSRDSGS